LTPRGGGGYIRAHLFGRKGLFFGFAAGKEVIMTGETNPYGVEFFDRDVPVT
jgi:hypothetical protein